MPRGLSNSFRSYLNVNIRKIAKSKSHIALYIVDDGRRNEEERKREKKTASNPAKEVINNESEKPRTP